MFLDLIDNLLDDLIDFKENVVKFFELDDNICLQKIIFSSASMNVR